MPEKTSSGCWGGPGAFRLLWRQVNNPIGWLLVAPVPNPIAKELIRRGQG